MAETRDDFNGRIDGGESLRDERMSAPPTPPVQVQRRPATAGSGLGVRADGARVVVAGYMMYIYM